MRGELSGHIICTVLEHAHRVSLLRRRRSGILLRYEQSAANRADILTKLVSTKVFETLRAVIDPERAAHRREPSRSRHHGVEDALLGRRLGAEPQGSMRVPVRAPAVATRADASQWD